MKYKITIWILAMLNFTEYSFCQEKGFDSLSKYSYRVFRIFRNDQKTGTAFFIVSNDTTYLVSNVHVLTGWNPKQLIWEDHEDTIWLRYTINGTNRDTVIPINVTTANDGPVKEFSVGYKIDLMKIAIKPPTGLTIHSINRLIDSSYFNKLPDSIFSYGYTNPDGAVEAFTSDLFLFKGEIDQNGYTSFINLIKSKYPGMSKRSLDSALYLKDLYNFITPLARPGNSGAPIFGRFYLDKRKTKCVYRFMGVIFAQEGNTMETWAIRPNAASRYLQNKL